VIKFYFSLAPNPMKVALLLEELGEQYEPIPIDTRRGQQHTPEYLTVNPNAKVPAIIDGDTIVFDSNAILLYLAEKAGKFIPKDLRTRAAALEWLFWQMGGLGPMSGQNNHFAHYAVDKIPYAIDRYRNEVNRLYGVMNKRLAGHEYLAGPYSIADMACYPWIVPWERQGQNIADFPHLKRWFEAIKARPAVIKAYEWTPKINPGQGGIRTAEERAILFGQTAQSVAAMAAKQ